MADIALHKTYATSDLWWTDIQAFMVAAGWTSHDTLDADSEVYKTNGSAHGYPYIYLELRRVTTTVTFTLWLYWNATTHVGTTQAYANTTYDQVVWDAATKMFMVGNADFVAIGKFVANQSLLVGFLDKLFYDTITTTTALASTGSGVSLAVASSTGFSKGQKIQIVGVDTEGRDQLQVQTIVDSTHIQVTSLPRDYASGAFVGVTPCPAMMGGYNSTLSNFAELCRFDHVGDEDGIIGEYAIATAAILSTYLDPDAGTGQYGLVPAQVNSYDKKGAIGWLDLNGLIRMSPAVTMSDMFAVQTGNQPEQGTPSGATNTTLTDTTKTWATNEWQNKMVLIVDGTASGATRKVNSNTVDTLTVETWDTNPDGTSTYRICDAVYRYLEDSFAIKEDREVL